VEQRSREAIRLSSGGARDLKHAAAPGGRTRRTSPAARKPSSPGSRKPTPASGAPTCLKEGLRLPFRLNGEAGKYALARWLSWASRCRIPEFTQRAEKIRNHLPSIHATPGHGLSNGLIDGEHQNKGPHPDGLRVPQPRSPHRPGHAHPRRPPTQPPRKMINEPPMQPALKPALKPAGGPQMTVKRSISFA
jgi:transposase